MKHIESKDCPCNPAVESYREPDEGRPVPPHITGPASYCPALATVAGVPCRFCFGPGSAEGACPDCGKPGGEPWRTHPAEGCYHYLACSKGEKVDGLELTRCKYCPLREPVAAEGSK